MKIVLSTVGLIGVAVGLFAFIRSFGKSKRNTFYINQFIFILTITITIMVGILYISTLLFLFQQILHQKQLVTRNGKKLQKKFFALKTQIQLQEFLQRKLKMLKKKNFNEQPACEYELTVYDHE